jgi:hypothetical protein
VPTLPEFTDKKELLTRLRADAESLAGWFEGRYEDVGFMVKDSVGSNTFRAFAHMPHPLSRAYYNCLQECGALSGA